ncbi:hypothetical protein PGTUg99_028152 [Puccinia graminis f. sp. tritici]|uniref:Uncharacterized protein n=1 Tax=Puccinia graminis f. sp. tritici TaxID=56615 RepID=A0A5B0SMM6_PUCGR|nr:hypothetical protein PGTUg99_028152 [Puccinia graminis f. sp. tritici]
MKCSATSWLLAALIGGSVVNMGAAVDLCPKCGRNKTRAIASTSDSQCLQFWTCVHNLPHPQCRELGVSSDVYYCDNCKQEWINSNCPWESMKHHWDHCPSNNQHPDLDQQPSK